MFPTVFTSRRDAGKRGAAVPGSAGPCPPQPPAKCQRPPQLGSRVSRVHSPQRRPGQLAPTRLTSAGIHRQCQPHHTFSVECPVCRARQLSGEHAGMISDPHCHRGVGAGIVPIPQMTKQRLGSGLLAPGHAELGSQVVIISSLNTPLLLSVLGGCCPQFLTTIRGRPGACLTTPAGAQGGPPGPPFWLGLCAT